MMFREKFRVRRASVAVLIALCLAGCDGAGEFVYNCEGFPVKFGANNEAELENNSFFMTFSGGHQADGDVFMYPDGSKHRPKVISALESYAVESKIREPGNAAKVHAICGKFGPGIVLVK